MGNEEQSIPHITSLRVTLAVTGGDGVPRCGGDGGGGGGDPFILRRSGGGGIYRALGLIL